MDETPRVTRPFLVYASLVCSAAVVVLVYSWEAFPFPFTAHFAMLAIAVLLSENYAFSIEQYSISLAFPMAMAAVVLGGPAYGCLVAALGTTNYQEIRARKPLPFVAFNFGQLVLSAGIAGLTYARVSELTSVRVSPFLLVANQGWVRADFPGVVLPMVTTALVCVATNMLLTAAAMGILTRQPIRSTITAMVGLAPTQLALAFVGYLIGGSLAISAITLPLFVAPLVVARQLYSRYAGMKVAFVDTVRSLIGALEAKDPYTRGHSERVSEYAAALGTALSLNPRDIERLEYAALLHDLGKLAVPSSILVKPGRLDDEEMALVRAHPSRGSEMIGRIPPLRDLAEAVAQHHEWHDGGGYPNHLDGNDVAISARILAVADAFDAMTSTRAYRPALTREQAVAELISRAGTQFDPEVVRLFIEARIGMLAEAGSVASAPDHMPQTEPLGIGS